MKHFWTHRDNIPEGLGYGQFSTTHLFMVALTVLFTVIITVVYHGLNAKSAQLKVQFCPGDAAGNQVCCSAGKITIDYYGTLCG